ncbi:DctP family TRAP transporter solute-binding subunit [Pelagibius sp.]|uniref:TRAP transporter substrate-binding protein n=1 Tax=Pelagibius sp. TaxID=1931238 RepID=UPI00262B94BB|nr:DctP family TRAP transporter solute-binding subunit [Pelagibius sp.]
MKHIARALVAAVALSWVMPAIAEASPIKLKFAHGAAPTNPRHAAAEHFADLVAKYTDGKAEVAIFPSGQLGNERQYLEALSSGAIEFAVAGTPIFAAYAPELELVDMPYLFSSYEKAWEVLDGPIGSKLIEPVESQGIKILAFWENGFRHVTNNVRPINTPEDLAGIKIRTSKSKVRMATFSAFDASPVPIAFRELYLALSQGVVDGQENPLTNIHSAKFWEVQKFLSLTGHVYGALPLAVSSKVWEELSPDMRAQIQRAASEAAAHHRALVQEADKTLIGVLEENGMQINTPADIAPFQKVATAVWKGYRERFGDVKVDEILKAAGAAQ